MLPVPVLHSGSLFVEEDVTAVGTTIVCDVAAAGHRLLSRTTTLCEPLFKPLKTAGDVHAANADPSREHV